MAPDTRPGPSLCRRGWGLSNCVCRRQRRQRLPVPAGSTKSSMMVSALWSGGTVAARSLQRLDFLRHEPIAAVHHAATFDIFLMGEVAQPYRGDAIRGPIVAHESFDH